MFILKFIYAYAWVTSYYKYIKEEEKTLEIKVADI